MSDFHLLCCFVVAECRFSLGVVEVKCVIVVEVILKKIKAQLNCKKLEVHTHPGKQCQQNISILLVIWTKKEKHMNKILEVPALT